MPGRFRCMNNNDDDDVVCDDIISGRSAQRGCLVGAVGLHVPTQLRRGFDPHLAVLRQRNRISPQLSRYSTILSSLLSGRVRAFPSGGATLCQSSAFTLPVCCHALPIALPVYSGTETKTVNNRTMLLPGSV